jgi:hypothetical protein
VISRTVRDERSVRRALTTASRDDTRRALRSIRCGAIRSLGHRRAARKDSLGDLGVIDP